MDLDLVSKKFFITCCVIVEAPSNLLFSKILKVKNITSAKEMMNEVKKSLPVDIAVCAAAVSDFKPISKNKNKIKKSDNSLNKISLEKNRFYCM